MKNDAYPDTTMNVPAAEPIANIAFTIIGIPSDDTADGGGEAEIVGLGAKNCNGAK
jgi:hypothetical protein